MKNNNISIKHFIFNAPPKKNKSIKQIYCFNNIYIFLIIHIYFGICLYFVLNLKPPPLLHLSQTGLLKGPEFILGPPLVPVLVADRPSGEVRPLHVADGAEVLLLFRGLKGGRIIEGVPLLSTCKPMPKKTPNDISASNINVNIFYLTLKV